MDKLDLLRSNDPSYNELLTSLWVLIGTFLFIVIVFAIASFAMKKVYRKSKHIYCLQLLKQAEKITDPEDLEYLKKIEPKLDSYAKKWWFNNSPALIRWVSKMNKIAEKYSLNVEIWNN